MIDARGYACPMPVLMVQKELKSNPAALEVLVDNQCAVENVTRFGQKQGYQVSSQAEGEDFRLKLSK